MERLKGKTAIVVGAGSIGPGWGNGKATAVTFAREGAQVFCVDRNQAAAQQTVDIITSEGGAATAFTADAASASDVEAMVAACLKAYGRINVLDNNVGIAEMGNVVDVSEASWDHVFNVNLKSAFLTMRGNGVPYRNVMSRHFEMSEPRPEEMVMQPRSFCAEVSAAHTA